MAIVVLSLWPFEFETDHRTVAQKMFNDRNMVPFRYTTSVWAAVAFVPLGLLLAHLIMDFAPKASTKKLIVLSGLICVALSIFTQFSQTICVGRYFDATDVVLALIGGAAGAALLDPFRSWAAGIDSK